ncbi:hypothetical protein QR77_00205 [Streptomyces sp. 150FB]|uniref:carbon-phosphorus lyase complex subunit PhnI n=1 Tax=Streptomyces sp. 150FB TaxID=1576605 RepID=UPI0005891CAD|nr:carbon-phosphorus lyase complex subunit PhnI [Streptomyces sp. 150FB]KIF72854.1 hypothetical protein QR77_00205 [Streptomyces sp. 150FB]
MGYSGVRGGQEAIAAAERLVEEARYGGSSSWLELEQITERMPLAVDRVMGEGGLWAPELTARAIRQSQGDLLEAAQLLRAHRSTLPRLAYSTPVSTDELRVARRISPAFRNPPGGQILGRTLDYVARRLDLTPEPEGRARDESVRADRVSAEETGADGVGMDGGGADGAGADGAGRERPSGRAGATTDTEGPDVPRACGSGAIPVSSGVVEALRDQGLLTGGPVPADPEPFDITRAPARPGTPRSARLSAMARAETGSLIHLWYASGRRPEHSGPEIPLELRRGRLPVRVTHPCTGNPVTVAAAAVTETRTIRGAGLPEEDHTRFDVGYGLCFGDNEAKALAMAGLDLLVRRDPETDGLEQKVLIHLDGPESSGFLEHLKLPHYVDFRSTLERIQAVHATSGGAR